MASYSEVLSMRDAVLDLLSEQFRLRPKAIGVMPLGEQNFALKVTLGRRPADDLPPYVRGIPVRYDMQIEPAVLVGETPMAWYDKAITRRRL